MTNDELLRDIRTLWEFKWLSSWHRAELGILQIEARRRGIEIDKFP